MPFFTSTSKFLLFHQFLKCSYLFTKSLHGFASWIFIYFLSQLYILCVLFRLLEFIRPFSFKSIFASLHQQLWASISSLFYTMRTSFGGILCVCLLQCFCILSYPIFPLFSLLCFHLPNIIQSYIQFPILVFFAELRFFHFAPVQLGLSVGLWFNVILFSFLALLCSLLTPYFSLPYFIHDHFHFFFPFCQVSIQYTCIFFPWAFFVSLCLSLSLSLSSFILIISTRQPFSTFLFLSLVGLANLVNV